MLLHLRLVKKLISAVCSRGLSWPFTRATKTTSETIAAVLIVVGRRLSSSKKRKNLSKNDLFPFSLCWSPPHKPLHHARSCRPAWMCRCTTIAPTPCARRPLSNASVFPVQTQNRVAAAPSDLGDAFAALRIELWTNEACGSGFQFAVAPDDCSITLMQNGAVFKSASAPLVCDTLVVSTGQPTELARCRPRLRVLRRRVPLQRRSVARRWAKPTK